MARRLLWRHPVPGRWETAEQVAGEPDFVITKEEGVGFRGYRLKSRTARQAVGPFDTLAAAKTYAEAV